MDEARDRVAAWCRWQAGWCERLGSPLYAALLGRVADDVGAGGPTWGVLTGLAHDPADSAPALRFMGAVHRIVLEGRAPDLARLYPSAGGTKTADPWPAFLDTIETNATELATSIVRPVQTNEVGRAGALVGGFLEAARGFHLPLRILECGASAGLNLRWDHFHYEARGRTWGPADSPVRLCDYNSEIPLPFEVEAEVVDRAGCDINPLDASTDEGRLTLLSYVWPDQTERIRLLRGALEIARHVPARLEKSSASSWVRGQLATLPEGIGTVVYHSIFFQYMSPEERSDFVGAIEEAGGRASASAPLAWLRLEPGGDQAEVRLKTWPGAVDRLVATAGFHGAAVRWLG